SLHRGARYVGCERPCAVVIEEEGLFPDGRATDGAASLSRYRHGSSAITSYPNQRPQSVERRWRRGRQPGRHRQPRLRAGALLRDRQASTRREEGGGDGVYLGFYAHQRRERAGDPAARGCLRQPVLDSEEHAGLAPVGPYVLTMDEVPDTDNLWVTC